jgi:hypothetical protein
MGIKLLVMKDRDKNEYRHYLQEYEARWGETINVSDDGLCPEHNTYIVEIQNNKNVSIDYIEYLTGTTDLVFGKAGRVDG